MRIGCTCRQTAGRRGRSPRLHSTVRTGKRAMGRDGRQGVGPWTKRALGGESIQNKSLFSPRALPCGLPFPGPRVMTQEHAVISRLLNGCTHPTAKNNFSEHDETPSISRGSFSLSSLLSLLLLHTLRRALSRLLDTCTLEGHAQHTRPHTQITRSE